MPQHVNLKPQIVAMSLAPEKVCVVYNTMGVFEVEMAQYIPSEYAWEAAQLAFFDRENALLMAYVFTQNPIFRMFL